MSTLQYELNKRVGGDKCDARDAKHFQTEHENAFSCLGPENNTDEHSGARSPDRFLKRLTDFVVAVVLLTMLSPTLIVISILIKMTSRGPVFYTQMRHGLHMKPFKILKFRTMYWSPRSDSDFQQTTRNDPRITWVGRVLRVTSLDELPQLCNVLAGHMSIVGPRPHAIGHDRMFANEIDRYWGRYQVRPGITGWAQIHGLRGATETVEMMRERVAFDLWYVENRTFLLDLRILLLTPGALTGKNAY